MRYCKNCTHCRRQSGAYYCDVDKTDLEDDDVEKYDQTCGCYSEE